VCAAAAELGVLHASANAHAGFVCVSCCLPMCACCRAVLCHVQWIATGAIPCVAQNQSLAFCTTHCKFVPPALLVMQWIATGAIPCVEGGGHYRPNHHARLAQEIFRCGGGGPLTHSHTHSLSEWHALTPSLRPNHHARLAQEIFRCGGPHSPVTQSLTNPLNLPSPHPWRCHSVT
jgi:hypothetical protein